MITSRKVFLLLAYIQNRYFGRRTIYIVGMAAMAIELCLIGILNVWTDKPAVAWTQAVLTLVWTFTFQLSAGQLGTLFDISVETVG